ncbi:hypothetical protein MetMK1DRAFT_00013440 [Metallosphaera yellowstonensis MK1]|jgi:hypothetical protein|uniref:Uncharacterized protein n=1 Tax=Metallosphaera yellowstonensis MK1 TaxID=671065 RepID=H2C3L9_9CREN|nr:hypothetical protein [Metallosphaera yellowstonensis]EHP70840.1 hypothetical protein MetMK1DRAFT_00013440 [Metallosphaera yellowstonensis MK1]
MIDDDRTATEPLRLELHLNLYSFRESIVRYRIEGEGEWLRLRGREGEYLARELESYAVLLYPVRSVSNEVLTALLNPIPSVDRLREVLMRPDLWRDYITFKLKVGEMDTTDLKLEDFLGRDLVNDVLRQYGVRLIQSDEFVEISVDLNEVSQRSLDTALRKVWLTLSLYHEIRESQEDVALKTAQKYVRAFQTNRG